MGTEAPSPPAAPARVLVVDDEPQIVRALKVVLRDAGFEAVAAETGAEALDLAAVRPPQAAIVDLMLPDIDGIEPDAPAARVERDADPGALRGRRGGAEGQGAGGGRR